MSACPQVASFLHHALPQTAGGVDALLVIFSLLYGHAIDILLASPIVSILA